VTPAPRHHPVDGAGEDDLVRAQAVAVLELAAEEVGDRREANMGMWAYVAQPVVVRTTPSRYRIVFDRAMLSKSIAAAVNFEADIFHLSCHGNSDGVVLADDESLTWKEPGGGVRAPRFCRTHSGEFELRGRAYKELKKAGLDARPLSGWERGSAGLG